MLNEKAKTQLLFAEMTKQRIWNNNRKWKIDYLFHWDKSIWRPGSIQCYSWEHYQLQQGKYMPSSNPCYSTVFFQLQLEIVPALVSLQFLVYFPGSTLALSQVQPGNCPRFVRCRIERILPKQSICATNLLCSACYLKGPEFNRRQIQFYFITPQLPLMLIK